MANVQAGQVFLLYSRGPLNVFLVNGVSTGDVWDASPWFRRVQAAQDVPLTGAVAGVFAAPAVSNNATLTFNQASLSLDDLYVVIYGAI